MLFKIKEFFYDLIRLAILILIVVVIFFVLKINADVGLTFAYRINDEYGFILLIKSFAVYSIVNILLSIYELLILFFIYRKSQKIKIIKLLYNRFLNFMDNL